MFSTKFSIGGWLLVGAMSLQSCGQRGSNSVSEQEFLDLEGSNVQTYEPAKVITPARIAQSQTIVPDTYFPKPELKYDESKFYVETEWEESYGDLSSLQPKTVTAEMAKAINTHPLGQERKYLAFANGLRHVMLNSDQSLDFLPLAVAQRIGVTCAKDILGFCLVSSEELFAANKKVSEAEIYRIQKEQLESLAAFTKESVAEFQTALLSYVSEKGIKLPAQPYLSLIQMNGQLQGLDPHSNLLMNADIERLRGSGDSSVIGIGVVTRELENKVVIVNVAPSGGAEEAGILPGDVIVSVDGQSVYVATEAVSRILGTEGSSVELVVERNGEKISKTIIRKRVEFLNVVLTKYSDADHLKYSSFTEDSFDSFKAAVGEAEESDTKALIVDLRNNPGGSVKTLVEITRLLTNAPQVPLFYNLIVKKGLTTFDGFRFADDVSEADKPLIVLTNANSASASEAVAANLKHLNHAMVIGDLSFGKGSMQGVNSIPGSEVSYVSTEGLYFTAKHYTPQFQGVVPDVVAQEMPNRPQLDENVFRERDLPLVIPVQQGQEPFDYAPSEEKQKQVQCAQDQDVQLKKYYMEKAQNTSYPGDYQLMLARAVAQTCL